MKTLNSLRLSPRLLKRFLRTLWVTGRRYMKNWRNYVNAYVTVKKRTPMDLTVSGKCHSSAYSNRSCTTTMI